MDGHFLSERNSYFCLLCYSQQVATVANSACRKGKWTSSYVAFIYSSTLYKMSHSPIYTSVFNRFLCNIHTHSQSNEYIRIQYLTQGYFGMLLSAQFNAKECKLVWSKLDVQYKFNLVKGSIHPLNCLSDLDLGMGAWSQESPELVTSPSQDQQKNGRWLMLTFTPAENLQPKVNLTCMSLDCRKKLRCPKRTYTDTRRTYKLQIKLSVGIFEPRLSILWANRKNPVYCFCDIENSTYLVNPLPFIVHPAELNKNICTYWKKELRYLRKQKFLFKKKKKKGKTERSDCKWDPASFIPSV